MQSPGRSKIGVGPQAVPTRGKGMTEKDKASRDLGEAKGEGISQGAGGCGPGGKQTLGRVPSKHTICAEKKRGQGCKTL